MCILTVLQFHVQAIRYTDASFAEDTKWGSQNPLVTPVTLYAKWSINEYTIQFSNTEFEPITFTVEDSVVLNNPYKQGYDFVEWRDENNQVVPSTIENTARNMTLTAVWKKIEDLIKPCYFWFWYTKRFGRYDSTRQSESKQVVQSAIDTIGTYSGNSVELVKKWNCFGKCVIRTNYNCCSKRANCFISRYGIDSWYAQSVKWR